MLNKMIKLIGQKIRELLPWIVAACTVLSANWAADAFMGTFSVWSSGTIGSFSLARAIYIVLFTFFAICFYYQRYAFFKPRTRYLKDEPVELRKHLVLFLSPLKPKVKHCNGVPAGLELSYDLNKDICLMEQHKRSNSYWPWEMPLRAIREHLPMVKTVTIVCSDKSIIEVNQFLDICKKYAEFSDCSYYLLIPGQRQLISAQKKVVCYKLGWNFESFNELSDAMWLLCKNFRKQGYAEKDIMIDFTGGQKVTSVVAAAITFNRKIKAQYVQTSDPWKVLSYDVIHASPDTGGFGT